MQMISAGAINKSLLDLKGGNIKELEHNMPQGIEEILFPTYALCPNLL